MRAFAEFAFVCLFILTVVLFARSSARRDVELEVINSRMALIEHRLEYLTEPTVGACSTSVGAAYTDTISFSRLDTPDSIVVNPQPRAAYKMGR